MDDMAKALSAGHSAVVPEALSIAAPGCSVLKRPVSRFAAVPLMVLFWFRPRRFGRALASTGWWMPILMHVSVLPFMIGLLYFPFRAKYQWQSVVGVNDVTEGVRIMFLLGVSAMRYEWSKVPIVVGACELGVLMSAFGAMPFVATGERWWSVLGRCLRLAFWSTTVAWPMGLFVTAAVCVFWGRSLSFDRWNMMGESFFWWAILAIFVYFVWSHGAMLAGGVGCRTLAAGREDEVRRVRCEGCGYILAGLPLVGRCPECGLAISESFPTRRGEPRFRRPKDGKERVCPQPSVYRVVFDRTFFRRLAIYSGHTRCRILFLLRCFYIGFSLAASVFLMEWLDLARFGVFVLFDSQWTWPWVAPMCLWVAFSCPFWATNVMAMVASWCGRRPYHLTAFVSMYAAPSLLVLALAAITLYCGYSALILAVGVHFDWWQAVFLFAGAGVGFIGGGALIVAGVLCLRRAFRDTRLASG